MEEAKENGTGGNGSLFVNTTAFNLKEHQKNSTKNKGDSLSDLLFINYSKKKYREMEVVPGNNCVLTNFLFEIAN